MRLAADREHVGGQVWPGELGALWLKDLEVLRRLFYLLCLTESPAPPPQSLTLLSRLRFARVFLSKYSSSRAFPPPTQIPLDPPTTLIICHASLVHCFKSVHCSKMML